MKNTALFLCSIILVSGFLPMIAQEEQKQVAITVQLTPEAWNNQRFASLISEHKRDVIGILQATQKCFNSMHDSVDKGVDTFLESLELTIKFYTQIAMTFTATTEICLSMTPIINELETKLPMIKALEILPSAKDVFEVATRFLSAKENMTEQDLKRALNKALRNKEIKAELKMILKKQCADIDGYINYVNINYAQEVAELAELKAQMQELLSKMQEQQS